MNAAECVPTALDKTSATPVGDLHGTCFGPPLGMVASRTAAGLERDLDETDEGPGDDHLKPSTSVVACRPSQGSGRDHPRTCEGPVMVQRDRPRPSMILICGNEQDALQGRGRGRFSPLSAGCPPQEPTLTRAKRAVRVVGSPYVRKIAASWRAES